MPACDFHSDCPQVQVLVTNLFFFVLRPPLCYLIQTYCLLPMWQHIWVFYSIVIATSHITVRRPQVRDVPLGPNLAIIVFSASAHPHFNLITLIPSKIFSNKICCVDALHTINPSSQRDSSRLKYFDRLLFGDVCQNFSVSTNLTEIIKDGPTSVTCNI